MFDLFRSRAKAVRIMLGGLLLLVALSMVTYLIPGAGTGGTNDSMIVAEFGRDVLTLPQVQQVIQAELRSQNIPPQMTSIFVPQIANQMITEYAVAYEAEQLGFRVSPTDIGRTIQMMMPQLFEGGKFAGPEAYAAVLAQQNMTIPQFEETLRKQLLLDAIRRLITESVAVSPQEIAQEFHARNDKVKIEYAAVPTSKYQNEVKLQPADLQAYYDQRKSSFQIPERRSIDVLVVDQAKLAQSITVPDSELRRIYDKNRDSYRVPERVHVRHILLKTTDVPKDQVPKIQAQAEDILKQLKAGGDFAALAKKSSQDPGSASKGGDLGWIVRGQTVKNFEGAAFSLKPNEISNLITTEYGFHILQVLEKQDAHLQPFDEVKNQLAEEQKKQMVFDRMQTLSDQARAALTKDPNGAEKIAAQLGLEFIRAADVAPGAPIPQIGPSPELLDALSSLRQGEVTPVVQVAPTKLAVAVLTKIQPARQAELSEVEAQVRQQLTQERVKTLVDQKAKELYEKAKSLNGDLRKAAQSLGLEVKAPPEFARDGAIEGLGSAGYVYDAFKTPAGELLGPAAYNGGMFVYKVIARQPADDALLAKERDTLVEQLRSAKARTRMEIFEDSLRQRLVAEGKIKINQEVLKRLASSYSGS